MTDIEKALAAYLGEVCGMRLQPHALTGLSKAAIAAMQPAPQEPVAWMYTHPDFPFHPSVRTDRHDKYDFAAMAKRGWTETPLYAFPTPPAGGSDAE